MATKPKLPFEKSKKDVEKPRFGKEGSRREEAYDRRQAAKPMKKAGRGC